MGGDLEGMFRQVEPLLAHEHLESVAADVANGVRRIAEGTAELARAEAVIRGIADRLPKTQTWAGKSVPAHTYMEVRLELAFHYHNAGKLEEARQVYRAIIDADGPPPTSPEGQVQRMLRGGDTPRKAKRWLAALDAGKPGPKRGW